MANAAEEELRKILEELEDSDLDEPELLEDVTEDPHPALEGDGVAQNDPEELDQDCGKEPEHSTKEDVADDPLPAPGGDGVGEIDPEELDQACEKESSTQEDVTVDPHPAPTVDGVGENDPAQLDQTCGKEPCIQDHVAEDSHPAPGGDVVQQNQPEELDQDCGKEPEHSIKKDVADDPHPAPTDDRVGENDTEGLGQACGKETSIQKDVAKDPHLPPGDDGVGENDPEQLDQTCGKETSIQEDVAEDPHPAPEGDGVAQNDPEKLDQNCGKEPEHSIKEDAADDPHPALTNDGDGENDPEELGQACEKETSIQDDVAEDPHLPPEDGGVDKHDEPDQDCGKEPCVQEDVTEDPHLPSRDEELDQTCVQEPCMQDHVAEDLPIGQNKPEELDQACGKESCIQESEQSPLSTESTDSDSSSSSSNSDSSDGDSEPEIEFERRASLVRRTPQQYQLRRIKCSKLPEICIPEKAETRGARCTLRGFDSDGFLYMMCNDLGPKHEKNHNDVITLMNSVYSKAVHSDPKTMQVDKTKVEVGELFVARKISRIADSIVDIFIRVQIIKVDKEHGIIHAVDIDDESLHTVSADNLFSFLSGFDSCPRKGFRCRLVGLEYFNGTSLVFDVLRKFIHIQKTNMVFHVPDYSGDNQDVPLIILYRSAEDNINMTPSVNQEMLSIIQRWNANIPFVPKTIIPDVKITHCTIAGDVFVQYQSCVLEALLKMQPMEEIQSLKPLDIINAMITSFNSGNDIFVKRVRNKYRRITILRENPVLYQKGQDFEADIPEYMDVMHTDFGETERCSYKEIIPFCYFPLIFESIPPQGFFAKLHTLSNEALLTSDSRAELMKGEVKVEIKHGAQPPNRCPTIIVHFPKTWKPKEPPTATRLQFPVPHEFRTDAEPNWTTQHHNYVSHLLKLQFTDVTA